MTEHVDRADLEPRFDRSDLEPRRVHVATMLTPKDRRIILDGRDGKPGDWIIQAITSPDDVPVKSLRIAIEICEGYLRRRSRQARQTVAQRATLNAASRHLATRAAIANVKTLEDDEVVQIARGIVRHATPEVILTPDVAKRLLSYEVDTQRQGLVLFAVANDGYKLAEKQRQDDALDALRQARAANNREQASRIQQLAADTAEARRREAAFISLFTRIGVARSRS